MRLAALGLAALLLAGPVSATPPNVILKAAYAEPTTRYDHGVLGDAVEWGALVLTVDTCDGCAERQVRRFTIRLPENRVFEDIAPRIIHDEFAMTYAMVVESDLALGARLAIYTAAGLSAATPFIGQRNRWLAPVGAGDLDGDGIPEIAYVEKPHLSRELKVWRFSEAGLEHVASLGGLSNHRIGEDYISGGIRDCGDGPEMVTADAGWQNVMATRLVAGRLVTRAIGAFIGKGSFAAAMGCVE
ncbi:MAG: VCBS repeat-containing protein [Rhodobacteraceae bacterium]|nr:VCBS repeat-containing protein [Paracoccaceae bacterium]